MFKNLFKEPDFERLDEDLIKKAQQFTEWTGYSNFSIASTLGAVGYATLSMHVTMLYRIGALPFTWCIAGVVLASIIYCPLILCLIMLGNKSWRGSEHAPAANPFRLHPFFMVVRILVFCVTILFMLPEDLKHVWFAFSDYWPKLLNSLIWAPFVYFAACVPPSTKLKDVRVKKKNQKAPVLF